MSPVLTIAGGSFPFSPRPHRADEIPWREWGPAALEDAAASDRPVLLSVVAAWSTVSHRADEGAYSDQRVIDLLASQFIAVRVDADERPDVVARYAPGVPSVAFLTPEGDPIASLGAGTATPEVSADALVHAAHEVLHEWYRDRDAIMQRVDAARSEEHTSE